MEKVLGVILEKLDVINTDIVGLRTDVIELNTKVNKVCIDISEVNKACMDISELKACALVVENKLDNCSKALFDGYKQNCEQILRNEDEISDIRKDLSAIELISANNWSEIAKIKATKVKNCNIE